VDLLIVTDPVASYLWSAGVKKAITLDFLSGVFTETVLVSEACAGAGAGDALEACSDFLGVGEGTILTGARAGMEARDGTDVSGAGAGAATLLALEAPWLMTTDPVASYRWSAGVKKEITLDFLSGVLTDTVRERDS